MIIKYIIARFNEDVSWTDALGDDRDIYNKGLDMSACGYAHVINLENVGREGDTYLRYIINNYDSLPDVCMFTQANIADHLHVNNPDILRGRVLQAIESKDGFSTSGRIHVYESEPNWGKTWNRKCSGVYKNNEYIDFGKWFETHISPEWPVDFIACPYRS